MNIVISGGGTGGHVNPALAVANRLKAESSDCKVLYIGTKDRIEAKLVPAEGYEIKFVKAKFLSRKLTLKNIDAAIKAVTSVIKAKSYLREFKPDVAFGTGGYVSWSAVKAAADLKIPIVIHEQNAYPGITTKMLSKYASCICISFEESRKFFPAECQDKIVFTGNPIKTDKFIYSHSDAKKQLGIPESTPYILSYGGSMGADLINKYCTDMIALQLSEKYSSGRRFTHATGSIGWEKYSAVCAEKGIDKAENVEVVEYIYDMPLRMAAADIVIARTGAITLAELAYLGKAAILIPSPNVAEDHQYKNAKVLEDAGAAVVFRESECSGEKLSEAVDSLLKNTEKLSMLGKNIRKFAAKDADKLICRQIYKTIT